MMVDVLGSEDLLGRTEQYANDCAMRRVGFTRTLSGSNARTSRACANQKHTGLSPRATLEKGPVLLLAGFRVRHAVHVV